MKVDIKKLIFVGTNEDGSLSYSVDFNYAVYNNTVPEWKENHGIIHLWYDDYCNDLNACWYDFKDNNFTGDLGWIRRYFICKSKKISQKLG